MSDFTLDLRGLTTFGHMIKAYDAFLKVWHQPPTLLLMTSEERQKIYPDNGTIYHKPYRWRDVPIKEIEND